MNRDEKAAAALAAYDALYKVPNEDRYIIDGDEAQVAADLAAALKEHLPVYCVVETYTEGKRGFTERIVANHLESKAAAQQWIAENDRSARRIFRIAEEALE